MKTILLLSIHGFIWSYIWIAIILIFAIIVGKYLTRKFNQADYKNWKKKTIVGNKYYRWAINANFQKLIEFDEDFLTEQDKSGYYYKRV